MVMQVRHSEPSGRVTLLDLDPDLGEMLAGDRADAARAELHVHVIEVSRGPWRPAALLPPNRANLGMLIVEGAAWRELSTHGDASAELLGPGDLVRTWHEDDQADSTRWDALTNLTIALLDVRTTVALSRYPELWLAILERVEARAERLATTQAISQMTGVDARLEALMGHLAERWGKVRTDGVRIPLNLSHRQLGALIGARRPTVSTAISLLAHQRRVLRCADGTWVLPRLEDHMPEFRRASLAPVAAA